MRPDFSCLPRDLAELYSGEPAEVEPVQLAFAVEPAEVEFKRWLLEQPVPAYLSAVTS